MMNWEEEIKKLEAELARLHEYLIHIPKNLQNGETANEIRSLIERAEEKVALLKESQKKFW